MELSTDEIRLLKTYQKGPRIWDAVTIFPIVLKLEMKGLITLEAGSNNAYILTAKGEELLSLV